ncbi:MAG: TIGR04282 family arsenosugar biosynthesis glycosyltransferase [Amphiplicatus sp.]
MREETLIVFVKLPVAGRVKTRLAREVGTGRAAALFRHMLTRTYAAARGRWRAVLAVDPPAALHDQVWPRDFDRMAQGKGDLGARMKDAFAAFDGPTVIIGADAPCVRAQHVRQAFRALGRHDAVFGPAHDGGYWLIGLAGRKRAPILFSGVRWSSAHALQDTMETLPADFSVAFLETLQDVDEAKDLAALGPMSAARPH